MKHLYPFWAQHNWPKGKKRTNLDMSGKMCYRKRFYPQYFINGGCPCTSYPCACSRASSPRAALIPAPSPDCRDWQQGGGLWWQPAPSAFLRSNLGDLKQRSPAAETRILVQRLIDVFRFLHRLLVYYSAHDNQKLKFEKWIKFSIYWKCTSRNNLCHWKTWSWYL